MQDKITCRCGADVTAPAEATVTTCASCGGQWIADRYSHDPDRGYVYISPEHAAQIARPRWTAGRPNVREVVTVSYQASVPLYYPVTDPAGMYGGSQTDSESCGHAHKTWQEAEKCGTRLARHIVAKRNAGR